MGEKANKRVAGENGFSASYGEMGVQCTCVCWFYPPRHPVVEGVMTKGEASQTDSAGAAQCKTAVVCEAAVQCDDVDNVVCYHCVGSDCAGTYRNKSCPYGNFGKT